MVCVLRLFPCSSSTEDNRSRSACLDGLYGALVFQPLNSPLVLAAGLEDTCWGTISFIATFNVFLCIGVTKEPEWASRMGGGPRWARWRDLSLPPSSPHKTPTLTWGFLLSYVAVFGISFCNTS